MNPLSLMFKLQHLIGIITKLGVMVRIQVMQILQFPVEYRHILKLALKLRQEIRFNRHQALTLTLFLQDFTD